MRNPAPVPGPEIKMKELLQTLLELQAIEFDDITLQRSDPGIEELRERIPLPVLGHYNRLTAHGKRGVAIVMHRVCTGCHMSLPVGTIVRLMRDEDIQVCENCGRYLYLPSEPEDLFLKGLESRRPAEKKKSLKSRTLAHAA